MFEVGVYPHLAGLNLAAHQNHNSPDKDIFSLTKDRNPFDILIAWVKFVDFITPIGIASNVGDIVTQLIINALKK